MTYIVLLFLKLDMISKVKELIGHSGCSVELHSHNSFNHTNYFVRKISKDIGYNKRQILQMEKQRKFNFDNIFTPKIKHTGYINQKFYFDMDFINCSTFSSYIKNLTNKELIDTFNDLTNIIFEFKEANSINTNNIFQNKIITLESNLSYNNDQISFAFKYLKNHDFSNIPHTFCHGDLTLENILISRDRKMYFIDFLDSFYDSWQIDIAKIFQDIFFYWSFRNSILDASTEIKLLLIREFIENKILTIYSRSVLIDIYSISLLNILRILPYSKDEATKIFCFNAIEKCKQKLNSLKDL